MFSVGARVGLGLHISREVASAVRAEEGTADVDR